MRSYRRAIERGTIATAVRSDGGEPVARKPQWSVDRRRARGHPALLRRVRWGNVGRLAALLAAGTLIATGGRACGEEPSATPPEELGAGVDRRDRERVDDALNRGGEHVPKDRAEARRPSRRSDGRRAERQSVKRRAARRNGANRERLERPPAKRQAGKRQHPGERPSARLRAPVGPPAPGLPAPPPVSGEVAPPVIGEADPPVGEPRPGGSEQITPPDERPAPPRSGEFTPDPAP
jgi:hypothetical protein